jgi:hypothetical protein
MSHRNNGATGGKPSKTAIAWDFQVWISAKLLRKHKSCTHYYPVDGAV